MVSRRLPPHDWTATSESGVIGVDGTGVRVRRCAAPEESPWLGTGTHVTWDIPPPGRRRLTLLPYPVPHMLRIGPQLLLCGAVHGRVVHELADVGAAFAIALRPGGLVGLFGLRDASALADRAVPLSRWIGTAGAIALSEALEAAESPAEKAAAVVGHLKHRDIRNPEAVRARCVIEDVLRPERAARVRDAAAHHGLSIRSLQRLFNAHIGLGPKAATRRCRLVDAATALVREPDAWTPVGARLGYFDQPHFINDFGSGLGITPAAFAAQCRHTRDTRPTGRRLELPWQRPAEAIA